MRILIAGCGYVGSELARLLLAENHEVYGLRRDPAQLPEGVHSVAADLTDVSTLETLPQGLDIVFYTASASGHSEEACRAAYVTGVKNLLEALKDQSPRRFFFTSSTGVYAQNDGELLDESSPATADRPTAQALCDGETFAHHADIPATVVRFSGIYGPGRTRLIDSAASGTARLEKGNTSYLNHIHRDDCAGVLLHLMHLKKPSKLYLATDDEPRSRNDLLAWIAETLRNPLPPSVDANDTVESSSTRGGNRRYSNQRLRDSGYTFKYPTFREGYGALIAARCGDK